MRKAEKKQKIFEDSVKVLLGRRPSLERVKTCEDTTAEKDLAQKKTAEKDLPEKKTAENALPQKKTAEKELPGKKQNTTNDHLVSKLALVCTIFSNQTP